MRPTRVAILLLTTALAVSYASPAAAQPVNDACGSAIPIGASPFTDSRDTALATTEGGVDASLCTGGGHSVWYTMVGTCAEVTVDTAGSAIDTVLDVFEGTCGAKTHVDCDDDSGPGVTSQLTFLAEPGVAYLMEAQSFSAGAGGALMFNVSIGPSLDGDGDGVNDCVDNCPATPNAGQEDGDLDGIGDACDCDFDAARIGFLYTDDRQAPNTVSGFCVLPSGVLGYVGTWSTGGDGSGGSSFFASTGARLRVTPQGRSVYAVNNEDGTIGAFNAAQDGALTAITGMPFAAGVGVLESLAVSPDGSCLMAGGDAGVHGFTVAVDGSLTAAGATQGGIAVNDMTVSPDGNYLVASVQSSDQIAVFTIAPDCQLSAVVGSPFAGGSGSGRGVAGLRFNATGDRLIAGVAATTTAVGLYAFAGGIPSPVVGSPFTFAPGLNSNVVLLSPMGDRLFVSNQASSSVTALQVGPGDALTQVPGSPFAAAGSSSPAGMEIDPTGSLLFLADFLGHLYAYEVDGSGALTPVVGSPFVIPVPSQASSLAFLAEPCSRHPTPGCRQPVQSAKAQLKIKDATPDAKDQLSWKWSKGDATTLADFGDPTTSEDYHVCIYDAGALLSTTRIAAGGMCAGKLCWKASSKGFQFKDKTLASDGAAQLQLKAGASGKAQIQFKGKGVGLETPALVLTGPVVVQLKQASDAVCWGSTFSAPFKKNDAGSFQDKAD